MRTILLCNSELLAMPTAIQLQQSGNLEAVVVPEKTGYILSAYLQQAGIKTDKIIVASKKNLSEELTTLAAIKKPDVLMALTFPWKIPGNILHVPAYGCINFHFGLLPEYKGADPVFWQLKNKEEYGGITVHKMTDEIDAGPVIHEEKIPLMQGETYGIHCLRLGQVAGQLVNTITDKIKKGITLSTGEHTQAKYFKAPNTQTLTIDWKNQTAEEIISLVNACNPKYGGAITYMRQMQINILEVAPIDLPNVPQEIEPGIIIHADAVYGLIVTCKNNRFLRITVAHMQEGYVSGVKLFALGCQPGESFS